jgi:hypothetical protein
MRFYTPDHKNLPLDDKFRHPPLIAGRIVISASSRRGV